MADTLTICVDATALQRGMAALDQALATGNHPALEEAQRNAAEAYLDFVRQWFLSAGGGTWAPLSESTLKEKQRKGLDPRPGFGSGSALFDSLMPGNPGSVLDVAGLAVTVGSSDPAMDRFHNGGPNTPARPVFVDPDQSTADAVAAAQLAGVVACIEDLIKP